MVFRIPVQRVTFLFRDVVVGELPQIVNRHLGTVREFELAGGYVEDAEVRELKIEVVALFGTLQNVGLNEFGFEIIEEQEMFM